MQHVYDTQHKAGDDGLFADDTSGQALCRKFCRENPKEFLSLLNKMREDHAKRVREVNTVNEKKGEGAGPSEGTAELVELIDRLLAEFSDAKGGIKGTR